MRGFVGADIFALPLILLVVMTGVLSHNEPPRNEKATPAISLPKSEMEGVSSSKDVEKVTLTANVTATGREYFIGSDAITEKTIPAEIKKRGATVVDLRLAGNMFHQEAMELWSLCEQGGATSISFIYEQTK